jgi:rhamnosyltransferase
MKISVIIPTCNAAEYLGPLFSVLERQTKPIDEIIIIDSQSGDNTVEMAKEHKNIRINKIERAGFNHGGTRHKAFLESTGDIVCFLTQDALPVNEFYIENLIKPIIDDSKVAMVGGRQIAREDASGIEKRVRLFNYKETSTIWDKKDRDKLGIKAFFISDSCSAYNRTAYISMSGFEKNILTNEDMEIAARFLENGYKLAYQANAEVYHSHNYTLLEQFKRNFDVGAFLSMYPKHFSKSRTKNEGMIMARKIFGELIKERHFLDMLYCGLDFSARLLGNIIGSRYKMFPLFFVKRMSGHKNWWDKA